MVINTEKNAPKKGTVKMPTAVSGPSRVWFLGHGCKQVPLESTGGKVLWAHQDGYFLNAQGQKVKHAFSPSSQKSRPNMHSAYPSMRQLGGKNCHHLMYEAFYGPRTKGMEIDHINGNKMDWSLDNLREITPMENRRCAKILRAMRAVGLDPRTYSREELLAIFQKYTIEENV